MKLHQLRYFQCLAHDLHYRKASEALYISQPTLSFAIKELEKKLGVALFKKEGRTIQLSQEGKIFLDYVSKSLQILDEGIHAIQPKKEIKISSIPTVINSFLVPFIIHLQKEQPQINIQLSKKEKVELKDLLDYPFYTYQKNMTLYSTIKDLFISQHLPFKPTNYLDDENSMIGLVNANLAVSIMEDNDTLLSYQNIIKKEISLPYKEREIYIVYDPLNISKLSLDIIQEMLNFQNV